jgi:hypothetical protein
MPCAAVSSRGEYRSLTCPPEIDPACIFGFCFGSISGGQVNPMKINADGSVDLYIGPKAPKGYENNWIPTGGKTPFLLFRFYGPTEPLFDKTFILNDVELVD